MLSFLFPTAWKKSPRPAPAPSFSRAAHSAILKSLLPPTAWGSLCSSPQSATSATRDRVTFSIVWEEALGLKGLNTHGRSVEMISKSLSVCSLPKLTIATRTRSYQFPSVPVLPVLAGYEPPPEFFPDPVGRQV